MDLRKLKTLIDLVSESNVSELEITEAEGKVRIVMGGGVTQQIATPMGVPAAARRLRCAFEPRPPRQAIRLTRLPRFP